MPACMVAAACSEAGVGKPPVKEPASRLAAAVPRTLWRFECGGWCGVKVGRSIAAV